VVTVSTEEELAQAARDYEAAQEWLNPTPVREETEERPS
jgi:hypothetical protein